MTYQYTNPNVFMRRYEESQTRRTEYPSDTFKLERGPAGRPYRNVIRVLPAHPNMLVRDETGNVEGADCIWCLGRIHFSLGPKQDTASPCLEPYGEPCPACDWVSELFRKGRTAADPNMGKQYKDIAFKQNAQLRFAANVVDMAHLEKGRQRWNFSDNVEKRLRACFLNDAVPPQFRDISHPETGANVIIGVSTKPNTDWPQYDEFRPAGEVSRLGDMAWLTQIEDLSLDVFKPTQQQVAEALQGKKINRNAPAALVGGAPPLSLSAPPAAPAYAPPAPAPAPGYAPPPASAPAPPAAAPAPGPYPMPAAPAPAPPPAAAAPPAQAPEDASKKGRQPRAPKPQAPAAAPQVVAAPPPYAPPPPAATPTAAPAYAPPPAPAQVIPAPPAPAPAPAPAAVAYAPPPAAVAPQNGWEVGYARAKTEVMTVGRTNPNTPAFTPLDVTLAEIAQAKTENSVPPCFTDETDPTQPECQGCGLIIACWGAKHGYLAIP